MSSQTLKAGDVSAAVVSSVLSALLVFLVAALAPQIRVSLHFNTAGLGFLVSLYYLSAAVSSVPLSRLIEAVGALRAMRWGCALMGLLLLVLAFTVHSFDGLAAIMAVAGLISAGLQNATNLFLVRRTPQNHHGFAFGIKQAAVPMAVLVSGFAVPAVALTLGWRWAFVIAAALAFVTSLAMPRSRISFAEYRSRPPIARLGGRATANLMLLACALALGVAAASALSAFTVTALTDAGQANATAGLLASLGGFAAAGTRIGMGIHADHSHRAHLRVAAAMLGVGALAYVVLALSTSTLSCLLIPAVAVAYAAGWGWNGLFNLAIVSHYPEQAARATGITSVGGRIGGVVGPSVFGLAATHASYTTAWLLVAGAAVCGTLILLAGHRLLKGQPLRPRR